MLRTTSTQPTIVRMFLMLGILLMSILVGCTGASATTASATPTAQRILPAYTDPITSEKIIVANQPTPVPLDEGIANPNTRAGAQPVGVMTGGSITVASATNETCIASLVNTQGLYAQASVQSQAQAQLIAGSRYGVQARTPDGWYRISAGNQIGWIQGAGLTLAGRCDVVPVANSLPQANLASNYGMGGAETIAPYDAELHDFALIASSSATFNEQVSYPAGDGRDTIRLTLGAGALQGQQYAVQLTCAGNAGERLRWGTLANPQQTCGTLLPVTQDVTLVVFMQGGTQQARIPYQLQAVPIAPADAEQSVMALGRDTGGVYRDAISMPVGDASDRVLVSATELTAQAPHNYRTFALTLTCQGEHSEHLRWGVTGAVHQLCGATWLTSLRHDASLLDVRVEWLAGTPRAFVAYQLSAVPIASPDGEGYVFGFDRDNGGRFNEVISAPAGDGRDLVRVQVNNLLANAPHNFREVDLTLVCAGSHIEQVRWGAPNHETHLCGQTVRLPFHANHQHDMVVALRGDLPAYVTYTLVAQVVTGESG
jgi:hypothetical protein